MKKILFFMQDNCTEVVGGILNVTTKLCELFMRNNYEVITCCFSKNNNERPIGLSKKIPFYNLENSIKSKDKIIQDFIRKIKPDLIFFAFPSYLNRANLKEEFEDISKIVMFHSRPDYYFEVDCDLDKFKLLSNYNVYYQILFPSFLGLIPKDLKPKTIFCIPNGIEIKNHKFNYKEHKKIIYLSRIDRLKGQDFLIRSFAKIARKYPDWKIDIYGESQPQNYVNKLQKLSKKYKVEKQIIFKGLTNTPYETMKNYDFCVFPSYFEGFGIGLAQALSMGLPAIGLLGCSGVNELIKNNNNGFLVKDNSKDFALKIAQLIDNTELRLKMGQNAINSVQKYNQDLINQMWLEIVLKILNKEKITQQIPKETKEIFPIKKIIKLGKVEKYKFIEKIFSLKNAFVERKKVKILTLLGIKIRIR